jgi:hypothetical protein
LIGSFMSRLFGTKRSLQLRRHLLLSSHAPNQRSSSIEEKNQSQHRPLFTEVTQKSAATIHAPAAAGKNTRSATEREEHDADALAPPPLKRPFRILLGGNLLEFPRLRQGSQYLSQFQLSFPGESRWDPASPARSARSLSVVKGGGGTKKAKLPRFANPEGAGL